MAEQMASETPAVEAKEALKVKRAGWTCITLFVVFVISLLSFGRAPLVRNNSPDLEVVSLDFISSLGITMGVFALIFLLTNFGRVLHLGKARKVLGLIGCSGLIVHSLLALFLPISYGDGPAPAVHTAGFQPLAQSGPEEWTIDGKAYKIASTYCLQLPQGYQYTIEYPFPISQVVGNIDDDRALTAVFPLMKHAYTNGLHTRGRFAITGQGAIEPSRIGVVLFEKRGGETAGYRVALSLDQIKKRIERESSSASTVPAHSAGEP